MHRAHYHANALLWAAAIIASALLDAPSSLTLLVLPMLAGTALLQTLARPRDRSCGTPAP